MANEVISIERLNDYNDNMLRDANILKRSTTYTLNQVVCKGQVVLKCSQAGTTNSTTLSLSGVAVDDELTDGTAKWKVISITGYGIGSGGGTGAGLEDWESNHDYAVDDIYVYEGEIYKTLIAFTSGATEDSRTKVNNIVPSVWAANTAYTAGDIIEHTDVTTLKKVYYEVTDNFTSGATFEVTAEMQELQITEEYVPNPLTHTQVQNLINNFVPSGSGTDPIFYNDTPIGTIISYMGITAPKDYLACDGTIYNIVDYKELAEYIKVQFGSYDYFGGDGTTTFAVPDLRGEFLRGSGTNSHTNQGSGANVGTHQDGTEHNYAYVDMATNLVLSHNTAPTTVDYNNDTSEHANYVANLGTAGATILGSYTSRPTNTSVLYCIKYNTSILSTPENNYSTEEQRIGTWIDGKPLYQKTYMVTTPANNTTASVVTLAANMDVKEYFGYVDDNGGSVGIPYMYNPSNNYICVWCNSDGYLRMRQSEYPNKTAYITIKYTKTTD